MNRRLSMTINHLFWSLCAIILIVSLFEVADSAPLKEKTQRIPSSCSEIIHPINPLQTGFSPRTGEQQQSSQNAISSKSVVTLAVSSAGGTNQADSIQTGHSASEISTTILISSHPTGAEIFIDGVQIGTTPQKILTLTQGRHRLKLRLEHFRDLDTLLVFTPGIEYEIDLLMEPENGWLSFFLTPEDTRIRLSPGRISTTLRKGESISLSPGYYTLHLDTPYHDSFDSTLYLGRGDTLVIKKTLLPSTGLLKVMTPIAGAKVYVDDQYLGMTPLSPKTLSAGESEITIERENYRSYHDQIQVKAGETVEISPMLSYLPEKKWSQRRSSARLLSLLVPGGGQLISGQYIRGGIYIGGMVAVMGMTAGQVSRYREKNDLLDHLKSRYQTAVDKASITHYYNMSQGTREEILNTRDKITRYAMTMGGIYFIQLLDSFIFGGGSHPRDRDAQFLPFVQPSARQMNETEINSPQFGISIRFDLEIPLISGQKEKK